jgi:hypothetical protein
MVKKALFFPIIILSVIPAGLFAQAGEDFDILQNKTGGITITGYRGEEKNVVIPETMGGVPVTVIGNRAFYNKSLTGVVIPGGVTKIEPEAFADNRLRELALNCTSIGYGAFSNNQLTGLSLSGGLTLIGPRAFAQNQLTAVAIPRSVAYIGNGAFAGNPLGAITIGANKNIYASQGFEQSFVNYYAGAEKKAGAYVKDGRVWSLRDEPGEGAQVPP